MNDLVSENQTRELRVNAAIAEYLAAAQGGRKPDRTDWLARHADVARELEEFLTDEDLFQGMVSPLRVETNTIAWNATPLDNGPAEAGDSLAASSSTTPTVIGDYEILDEIARGGMGVVYKARHCILNRIVALKMVLGSRLASPRDIERFQREAEAAARLDHPHIVPIYEVGTIDGLPYFSMRLIEGGRLTDGSTSWEIARRVARVAHAVHYAHQRGILHRDLKPSNILVDGHGEPHVADFGLAKQIEGKAAHSRSGAIVGTPSYMAPEQTRGEQLTTAVDVYGVGAILYELLTGQAPFRGETTAETLLLVMTQEPVRPTHQRGDVPRDLETICLKCLEKDPLKRYSSAEALAEDLERWLAGEPIAARAAGRLERTAKWVRRHPAPTALALVSLVALFALIGIGVARSYNADLAQANDKLASAYGKLEATSAELETTLDEARRLKTEAERQRSRAREQEANARRYLYTSRLTLAQRAEQEGQPARVIQLLRSIIPESLDHEDLRGWEWHHLWRKYNGEQSRLRGHLGSVAAVAVSPDEKLFASASADRTIKLWDAIHGKEVRQLEGHTDRVTSITWSADSRLLISASADKTVRIWDAADGKSRMCLHGHEQCVNSVAISSSGKLIASAGADATVRIWDAHTGKTIKNCLNFVGPVISVAFDPAGTRLACLTRNEVKFLLAPSGEFDTALAVAGDPVCVVFCPQGKRLAVGANLPQQNFKENRPTGQVAIILLDTKTTLRTLKQPDVSLTQIAFSPNGKELAVSNLNRTVTIWDHVAGDQTAVFHADSAVQAVAYSPDGTRIIAGTLNRLLMVWSRSNLPARIMDLPGRAIHVAFDSTGRRIVASVDGQASVWDLMNGRELAKPKLPSGYGYARIAWSPGNDCFAGLSTLKLLDAASGDMRLSLKVPDNAPAPSNQPLGSAFSPDGKLVAVANADGLAGVWDITTGQCIRAFRMPKWTSCVAFSPDSKLLAAGSGHGTALPRGGVKVWDIATGNEAVALSREMYEGVWSIAFSANGKLLAAATGHHQSPRGADTGYVWVWDMQTGSVVYTLTGHNCTVWNLSFSPDGKRLASVSGPSLVTGGGRGGELRIWDMGTGEAVWALAEDEPLYGVAFSPDGRRIACAGRRTLKIWDGTPVAQTPPYEALPVNE